LPIQSGAETYYTAAEAARYLGISRDTFYRNVRDRLRVYKHGALRRDYFLQSELDRFRGVHPAEETGESDGN
jgi:excisionase family DNA binding protein